MIRELISFAEGGDMPRRYNLLNEEIDKILEQLKKNMGKKGKKKLDKLCTYFEEVCQIETDEYFERRFRTGNTNIV